MPSVDQSAELLLNKQAQLRLQQRKIDALRRDGLPFYRPHPKQDRFHRSLAKRRGVFTGNRFGKSTMGCAEDCAWLRGERVWLPANDPSRRLGIPQRPVKGLVVANDWDKVKEIWTGDDGKIWKFFPRETLAKTARNHSGAVDTLVVKSPFSGLSTLRFDTVQSFKSNPLGSESSDWDFIHVDEPCPEKMFKSAARGLVDRGGFAWFTLTSIAEPWITDAFEPGGVFYDIGYKIEGTIWDNIYLSAENIEDYKRTLDADEIECRLYGLPMHKAGLVYKQFQWDKHVLETVPKGWRSMSEPPKDWPHYYYIDPHPKVPHMVLLLVCDPRGRLFVYDDIFKRCLISELCKEMRQRLDGCHIVRGRIDPLAYIEDQVNGGCWADEFARYGFPVDKAVKDPLHGISRVQDLLVSDPQMIWFSPAAKRTLWEIQRFTWDPENNKPVDTDDHAMECLYRAVLDEPCWVERSSRFTPIDDIVIDSPRFDLDDEPISLSL
jgi:hypothetical protein